MAEQPVHLNLQMSQEMSGGVYAETAVVWHTAEGFTIDFIAPSMPPKPNEEGRLTQDSMVVARVRLPVRVIFQVARAISENVSLYESRYGEIGRGGPEHAPPEA